MNIIGTSILLKDFGITNLNLEYTLKNNLFTNHVYYFNSNFTIHKIFKLPKRPLYIIPSRFIERYLLKQLDSLEIEDGHGNIEVNLNTFYMVNNLNVELIRYERITTESKISL